MKKNQNNALRGTRNALSGKQMAHQSYNIQNGTRHSIRRRVGMSAKTSPKRSLNTRLLTELRMSINEFINTINNINNALYYYDHTN